MDTKKLITILIIILLLSSSCQNSLKKESIPTIKLNHINIPLKKKIQDPHELIYVNNNRFIVLNGYANTFFELFDLNHKKSISFGLKGRGPGELLSAISPIFKKSNMNLYVFDMMKGEYFSFSLKDISKITTKALKRFSINRTKGWPMNYIPFGDSLFIANGTFKNNRFGLFNSTGRLLYTFGTYPNIEANKKFNNSQLSMGYNGTICSHPDKLRFVSIIPHSDLIEIYEKRNNDFILINDNYQLQYPPCLKLFKMGKQWTMAPCENSIIGFWGCTVSDRFIFSAFGKEKLNDLLSGKVSYPNLIRVYNWNGTYVANLQLDYPIALYTVVRRGKTHILYAIAINSNNKNNPYKMVKYEFKL